MANASWIQYPAVTNPTGDTSPGATGIGGDQMPSIASMDAAVANGGQSPVAPIDYNQMGNQELIQMAGDAAAGGANVGQIGTWAAQNLDQSRMNELFGQDATTGYAGFGSDINQNYGRTIGQIANQWDERTPEASRRGYQRIDPLTGHAVDAQGNYVANAEFYQSPGGAGSGQGTVVGSMPPSDAPGGPGVPGVAGDVQGGSGMPSQNYNTSVTDWLNQITQSDSPIMTQARTNAMRGAQSRGLLNTQGALLGAQNAAYQAALPLAQQEAETGARFGLQQQGGQIQSALSAQGYGQQRGLGEQQQGFNIQNMDIGQRNTLEQMASSQGYNLATMDAQQINQLAQMAVSQGFNMDTLYQQQQYGLESMGVQHGFDVENMSTAQLNQLEQMGTAQGFAMDTMSAQSMNALAQMEAQFGFSDRLQESQNALAERMQTAGFTNEQQQSMVAANNTFTDNLLAAAGRIMTTPGATWTAAMQTSMENIIIASRNWNADFLDMPLAGE
ncbi:MAG: hypothetical protein KZQ81_14275 [Candidatus Thiodiazotropha sp. (ex Rostrolucina anterorostrata)]|nr:hypothetical protein [Candidatus Thiodiazotropha sp. (ex Rostrolucina anterorostrata)]